MRDESIPSFNAQLDELAHKLALRFDTQGLRLFTDPTGNVPADTPPDPGTGLPVSYVGFASQIQVNDSIIDNPDLLRQGTAPTDVPVPSSSNEVVRRILEFTFGDTSYQNASGTIDIRSDATGNNTLQNWLGLYSNNDITGSREIASAPDFFADPASPLLDPGANPNQEFEITIDTVTAPPTPAVVNPVTLTINLADIRNVIDPLPNTTDDADDLVTLINTEVTNASLSTDDLQAQIDSNGRLKLTSRYDLSINNTTAPPGTLG